MFGLPEPGAAANKERAIGPSEATLIMKKQVPVITASTAEREADKPTQKTPTRLTLPIILTINAVLLAAYCFGCHSFRHMIGGRSDCMSCGKATLQYGAWKKATWFNERHLEFAWLSLIWVMVTDLYIRLLSMGVITDLNTWN